MGSKVKLLLVAAAVAAAVGCARNEIDRAIDKLGGNERERREAELELTLTSRDPMPKLIKAVVDHKRSPKLRSNVARVIGIISERQEDRRAEGALIQVLSEPDQSLRMEAMVALSKIKSDSALTVLSKMLDDEDRQIRIKATECLKKVAEELVEEARKLEAKGDKDEAGASLIKAASYNPYNGKVLDALAGFYKRQGKIEKADSIYASLGLIREWWLIGPFPNPDHRGFKVQYPPEREIRFDRSYRGKDGKRVRWFKHSGPKDGRIDLVGPFKGVADTDSALAYGFCYVYSPVSQKVQMHIGSDDANILWLNGKKVHELHVHRPLRIDDDVFEATLEQGDNRLLVKITNGDLGWGFMVRITDSEGRPLKGIKYKLTL